MKRHLIVIYSTLLLLVLLTLLNRNSNQAGISDRLTKIEFFQEATRIRDNVVGFKQVNFTLLDDSERAKSCSESKDLLTEWSDDIKKLGDDYSSFVQKHGDAKSYFNSINKLNDSNIEECSKLSTNQ